MAKIGRNDPCPCGSGRKYKHCCYSKPFVQARPAESYASDSEWLKIRRTEGLMVSRVLEFALSRYGKAFFDEALEEFGLWGEYEVDELHRETMILPWAAFNWVPESEELSEGTPEPVALEYLEESVHTLEQYQQAFIREACAQPYTFFVVTDVCPGESLGIRDILLSRTFTVKEAAASKMLKRGDIVFSRVIELKGQAIMVGMAPTVLPPRQHHAILDMRDDFKKRLQRGGFKLDQRLLLDYDLEMRSSYFELVERLANPPPLELRNTDGEPLKFAKLYFKLHCPPQEALDALKSLSLPEFQEGLLADAEFDASGNLKEVSFDWQKRGNRAQKHWDNTILGTITINGDLLTAEVNSAERAEKIKSEIEKRLKERAVFQRAHHESVESKLKEGKNRSSSRGSKESRREREEFQSRPEVQALVRKQIAAHWEGWYNERIPALNNKTPLQAARTKSGRERLEALLLEYEQNNERASDPNLRVDVAAMRKKLGI